MSTSPPDGEAVSLEAEHLRALGVVARGLARPLQVELADEWALAARFEHASIASFNKFSLELLALGAPGSS